jgi:hypothetical protein
MHTDLHDIACSGPGAYTPQEPQSPSKKHRAPEVSNPSATRSIAALQAKLRSSRRAACIEASAVEEVVRATLKHGTVEVRPNTAIMPVYMLMMFVYIYICLKFSVYLIILLVYMFISVCMYTDVKFLDSR